jgi:uncharacterized integral membrane protein (TIGR00698 family)
MLKPRQMGLGIAACVVLGSVAFFAGREQPLVGAPVIGVMIGIVTAALLPSGTRTSLKPGLRFVQTSILQVAIILLGTTLDLKSVYLAGATSLPVMLGTLALCLTAAALFGWALRIDSVLRILIGVGTAICGVSAIAAISPIMAATEAQIAYAISTIFVFNVAALFVFPPVGHALHLSTTAFALWAGTAVNDTSSVVATGLAYGPLVGNAAIAVKLTRTLLIIPIVVVLSLRQTARSKIRFQNLLPGFVIGFIAASVVGTTGVIQAPALEMIAAAALYLIVLATTAIGLSTDFATLRKTGVRPLLLGLALWLVVAASSLALAHAFLPWL